LKGQFPDMIKMSSAAKMHGPFSYLATASNDMALCGTHLAKARSCEDPVERLKWICAFYVGG